ncbi:MAG: hypothetical protein ABI192_20270 [Bradyrhizobium sp.]
MRDTKASDSRANGWFVQISSDVPVRALRIAAVALAVGFVMMTGAARAQDDDDDDQSFEEKIIGGLMAGVGATNMDNRGIDYRERSPLVVPPKIDLPPPATASTEVNAPNWPKDPDIARHKALVAARKKEKVKDLYEVGRPLKPSELNVGKTTASTGGPGEPVQPGQGSTLLSPSQLGYTGGLTGIFGGNKSEEAPFKGEPTRESLTQPPVGYQTPSPNFAYGTGPKESLNKNFNVMTGKDQ